jgi:hypothetical protein
MKNQAPNIYNLPLQLQKEYHLLIKTKGEFSKKQSRADQYALTTLYDELVDVWNRDTTEALKTDLDQKYQELREIQKELENNCEEYKIKEEQKYNKNIVDRKVAWRKRART